MGSRLSGWYGRRSVTPYFDEIPRLAVGEIASRQAGVYRWHGAVVQLVKIAHGYGKALRMICSRCGRSCTVIYFSPAACCYRCTDARYRSQSESSRRRALRGAYATLHRHHAEPGRPCWKPRWMRWPTFLRRREAAEAAAEIITEAEGFATDAIAEADRRAERLLIKKRG